MGIVLSLIKRVALACTCQSTCNHNENIIINLNQDEGETTVDFNADGSLTIIHKSSDSSSENMSEDDTPCSSKGYSDKEDEWYSKDWGYSDKEK